VQHVSQRVHFAPSLLRGFPLPFAHVEASRTRQQNQAMVRVRRFSEHAAERILELEGDPHGALFFRVYVDPNPLTAVAVTGTDDAEILSRLEYQSEKPFYLLERSLS
jgi:hypothetical protein